MRNAGWWFSLSVLTLLLVLLSPIFSLHGRFWSGLLLWAAHLPFVLILWSFGWHGPLWGLAALTWLCGVVGLVGLASRSGALLWLPVEFVVFGLLAHRGVENQQALLREAALDGERALEEIRTLEEELRRLGEMGAAAEERLKRYQKLRQVTNAFHISLSPEEVAECIVQVGGDLIRAADHVLLYSVEAEILELELKEVWRRSGSLTFREKRGDPFDHWVMRQAQPLLVEEVAHDFRFPQVSPEKLGRPLGAVLVVPLIAKNRALGVLRLESVVPRGLTADDLRLVAILGDLASLGLENSHLYSRMAQLAMTDDLTGLAMRGHFQKEFAQEILRVKEQKRCLSLLLIDIDHFKGYNDRFGHSAGDKLLRHIGRLLLEIHRPDDLVARLGGEEFVCLFPGVGLEEAARRGEEIRSRVEAAPVELRRAVTRTTVSVGIATYPADGTTTEALLATADRRMYQAKALGRNRVCEIG